MEGEGVDERGRGLGDRELDIDWNMRCDGSIVIYFRLRNHLLFPPSKKLSSHSSGKKLSKHETQSTTRRTARSF